jgi:glutathione S-transferase
MLEVTATPYDGIMYFDGGRVGETQTPWDVRKPSSQLGYMPIYTGPELPGMELSESGAIVRHLARLGGLAGKDDAEACMADMIFEASKSIPNIPGGWRVDDVLLGGGDLTKMKTYLERVEKLLVTNGSGALKHFVGSALTFGDIGMFMPLQVLEETESGVIKRLGFDACVASSFSSFGAARSSSRKPVAWCIMCSTLYAQARNLPCIDGCNASYRNISCLGSSSAHVR